MPEELKVENQYLHRVLLIALGTTVLFGLIVGRLYYLQKIRHEDYVKAAQGQHVKTVKITPRRATIYSAEGHPLATSSFQETVYISPRAIRESRSIKGDEAAMRELALRIAECLDIPFETVLEKIQYQGTRDLLLKRRLPQNEALELLSIRQAFRLSTYAIQFQEEGTRHYPRGALASHVIGLTRADDYGDNIGVSGVELACDDQLSGTLLQEPRTRRVLSTRDDEAIHEASGNDVYLTINENIQHYAEEAVASAVEKYEAEGGVCVVLEVGTGRVLAMVSNPGFDLNDPGSHPPANRCLFHAISPGSVMKTFTAAALLEENLMSPYETIDCENGYKVFTGGRVIRDSHRDNEVSVLQAYYDSSNVAFVKLGLRLEKEVFHDYLTRLRFGRKTGIDLGGERVGILRGPNRWNEQSRISLPIGYELTVTPIQAAAALAAIANGGQYIEPRVIEEIRSPRGRSLFKAQPKILDRVCSPQTAEIVLMMMEHVVTHGTGKGRAEVPGYRVGGKTGTTVKDDAPGPGDDPDEKRYYASFSGILPIDNPRVVIYTWIDEPNKKWGGTVAAPIFQEVAAHCMRILDVNPTEPIELAEEEEAPAEPAMARADEEQTEPLAAPALPGIAPRGLMPDLTGLTVREVTEELQRHKLDARYVGWGVARQQRPLAETPIDDATRALVVFESPLERRSQ